MRIFPKGLREKLASLESSISWLMTMTDSTMKWSHLPNSEIKILGERVNLMNKTIDEIYSRLNKYELS